MSAVLKSFTNQALEFLHSCTLNQALSTYEHIIHDDSVPDQQIADIAKGDRFFLLTHILHRPDAIDPWLFERCREVEADTDGHLDLWARAHYKSTLITFAGSIQEILNNPEITIGIFSHTGKIARKFTGQIKRELEQNRYLQSLFPDILHQNPRSQAQKWADDALTVRRSTNPAEATVEAWGLVDGQPIGKHFQLMIYDDVVVWESVQTAEQITKTTEGWELSLNLADTHKHRAWYIGTRYDIADTYRDLMTREAAQPRLYPATDNGTTSGKPVFLTQEALDEKLKQMGMKTYACQMLQNPAAGGNAEFSLTNVHLYEIRPYTLNVYVMCDYAGSRKTGSNRTAIAVIGMDNARNMYLLDGVCHRLTLSDRWKWLRHYHKKWSNQPGVQAVSVGYERYGAQSDIEHCQMMMKIEDYHFTINELNTPREGEISKNNRIRRLSPHHENGSFFYPYHPNLRIEGSSYNWIDGNDSAYTREQLRCIAERKDYLVARRINHLDENKNAYNLLKWFLDTEYMYFPTSKDKDFLDAMSRIYDMSPSPPVVYNPSDVYPEAEPD